MEDKRSALVEMKKKYVRMAFETNNKFKTAKAAGISRTTFNEWIRRYGDEVAEELENEEIPIHEGPISRSELEKRYEKALKLLGEKELEVAVLREAIEKKSFLSRSARSGPSMDRSRVSSPSHHRDPSCRSLDLLCRLSQTFHDHIPSFNETAARPSDSWLFDDKRGEKNPRRADQRAADGAFLRRVDEHKWV
ncbi:hypothetical protein ALCH109712_02410 [Alkalicoccus chagannorensis]